jgi:phospholipid/cholesterol/gamma-HCH transport system ATP-binding protein
MAHLTGPAVAVENLTLTYGERVVMRDLRFTVPRGEVFVIMGGSGSGKSTLLKHLVGLLPAPAGAIEIVGADLSSADDTTRRATLKRIGVLYQGGALWSGLTLAENVALPLEELTALDAATVADVVSLKLALVGLRGFGDLYPSAISGGMRKRASLARAMALDPDVIFLDEPSSGLDPISASRLDDLILALAASLGTTVVVVTHDLASIFRIADRALFLDITTRTMTALGNPADLLASPPNDEVRRFLARDSSSGALP